MKRKNDIIIPNVGSTVRTNVIGGTHRSKIIKVKEVVINRHNSYLIKYVDKKGKDSFINCGWVTEIIEHGAAVPKPINIFNKDNEDSFIHYKKTYYCGSLSSIVSNCMRKLPHKITRPLDWQKVEALFNKTKPGFVGNLSFGLNSNAGYPIIKKKKIQKWVAINWHKFLRSEKEWQKEIDIEEKEISRQYWEDMERDMDNEFWEND